jgi:hypothetical protein
MADGFSIGVEAGESPANRSKYIVLQAVVVGEERV